MLPHLACGWFVTWPSSGLRASSASTYSISVVYTYHGPATISSYIYVGYTTGRQSYICLIYNGATPFFPLCGSRHELSLASYVALALIIVLRNIPPRALHPATPISAYCSFPSASLPGLLPLETCEFHKGFSALVLITSSACAIFFRATL